MYRIIKYLMYFLSTHMYIFFLLCTYYIYLLYIYDEFTTEVTGADGFLA